MKYNFDTYIPRENTASLKYDMRSEIFGSADLLPMWVADMDFETPSFIREAIINRSNHSLYGYTFRPDSFYTSIINWMKRRHNWEIKKEWIAFSPGVVPALNMAVLAFTKPGEKVIVQPPVYFPFFTAVKNHQRELVYNPLIEKEGKYYMDFVDLEKKIDKKTRLLFLCHPHNPVGRLWSPGELKTLAEICIRKNVLIVADEIHSDLILNGNVHVPFASLSDETAKISLTTISPSKTFNLAGLSTAALIIPDPEIKKLYEKILDDLHIGMGNIFGNISLEAAYNHGDQWLSELLDYLNTNLRILNEFLSLKIPGIRVIQPEATYLVWLDFRGLGMNHKKLKDLIIHKAKLGLGDGMLFGPGGRGFQRINIALPSSGLLLALERLEKALML